MKSKFLNILHIVILIIILNCKQQEGKLNTNWPKLSDYRAIQGRVATEKDVEEGLAAFTLKLDGKYVGIPMNILLPQYAIHIDNETKEKIQCIVIQAEINELDEFIGCVRIKDNTHLVGMKNEFIFLGTEKPN